MLRERTSACATRFSVPIPGSFALAPLALDGIGENEIFALGSKSDKVSTSLLVPIARE